MPGTVLSPRDIAGSKTDTVAVLMNVASRQTVVSTRTEKLQPTVSAMKKGMGCYKTQLS